MKRNGKNFLTFGIMLALLFAVWTVLVQTADVKPLGQNGKISVARGTAADSIMKPFEERSRLLHDEEYFMKKWREFYLNDAEGRLKRLGIITQDGVVTDETLLRSLSNMMCAEIHHESITDYLTDRRRSIFGPLLVDGE